MFRQRCTALREAFRSKEHKTNTLIYVRFALFRMVKTLKYTELKFVKSQCLKITTLRSLLFNFMYFQNFNILITPVIVLICIMRFPFCKSNLSLKFSILPNIFLLCSKLAPILSRLCHFQRFLVSFIFTLKYPFCLTSRLLLTNQYVSVLSHLQNILLVIYGICLILFPVKNSFFKV